MSDCVARPCTESCLNRSCALQDVFRPGYFDLVRTWPACIQYSQRAAVSASIMAERGDLTPSQLPYASLQTLVHATFHVVMQEANVCRTVKDGYAAFRAGFERVGKACWWPRLGESRASAAAPTAGASADLEEVRGADTQGTGSGEGPASEAPVGESAIGLTSVRDAGEAALVPDRTGPEGAAPDTDVGSCGAPSAAFAHPPPEQSDQQAHLTLPSTTQGADHGVFL